MASDMVGCTLRSIKRAFFLLLCSANSVDLKQLRHTPFLPVRTGSFSVLLLGQEKLGRYGGDSQATHPSRTPNGGWRGGKHMGKKPQLLQGCSSFTAPDLWKTKWEEQKKWVLNTFDLQESLQTAPALSTGYPGLHLPSRPRRKH